MSDALPAGVAPWLTVPSTAELPRAFAARAFASRRFPGKPPASDVQTSWQQFAAMANDLCAIDVGKSSAPYRAALTEAAERIKSRNMHGSSESDAVLLAVATIIERHYMEDACVPFVDFLVAQKGLPHAVSALLSMMRAGYMPDQWEKAVWSITASHKRYQASIGEITPTRRSLRAHLAHASLDTWDQCATLLTAAIPELAPRYHPAIALLLPERPELSNQIVRAMQSEHMSNIDSWLLLTVDAADCIDKLHTLAVSNDSWMDRHLVYASDAAVATIVLEHGSAAIERLRPGASLDGPALALGSFGLPQAITALARARNSSKDALKRFNAAIEHWPLAAIAAISDILGPDLRSRDCTSLRAALAALVYEQAAQLPGVMPWLSPSGARALSALAKQYAAPRDTAPAADLPRILSDPPWLRATRHTPAPIALDPLPIAPVERWSVAERTMLAQDDGYSVRTYALSGAILPPAVEHAHDAVAAGDAKGIAAIWRKCRADGWLAIPNAPAIVKLPDPLGVEVWNLLSDLDMHGPGQAVAAFGVRGAAGIATMCERRPAQGLVFAQHIGAIELAQPIARIYCTSRQRDVRFQARDWLLAYPEHAACALLAPALGKPGNARQQARTCLRLLEASIQAALVQTVAARYQMPQVDHAVSEMLAEDPLDLQPARIGKLPDFWKPWAWTRPRLAKNGMALPDDVLVHIGTMQRFPMKDEPYAGLAQLKASCTADSLADFAWDGFSAWLMAGADPKENWPFTTLGLLGNDETARRLTPYIRSWPGEGQHLRAVTGLDVLAQIGTDTALMLLNGIAQKVKFKGLQDRAREKIQQIAETRNLTTEELEDRLAPDLGLDEQGTLLLNFGQRHFSVGFDEALKPFVRSMDGMRLADLPKPRQTDDAALSGEAMQRYKLLKKDARTIAAQQIMRLEVAMCAQRRWLPEVFDSFLARHPLVRHLVQRVVWASYRVDDGTTHGGRLLACFRVGPDGSLTDASDDTVELPHGEDIRIGIPHALDLPPADALAFGQLFADYQMVQPFSQIGRDTYVLDAEERASDRLLRWERIVVPTGRVMGLASKGWRRGTPRDGGATLEYTKPLGDGNIIELLLTPGIIAGMADEHPEQTLGAIITGTPQGWAGVRNRLPLSSLDPIAASELIRDMENLRA